MERTRDETEAANHLALSLANDMARGRRTAEEARRVYAEQIRAMRAGRLPRAVNAAST